MRKRTVYVALLASAQEPGPETGYARAPVEDVDILDVPYMLDDRQIVFNDVVMPYGLIDSVAAYDAPEGGELLYTWPLPEPVDIHEGVVPAILDGRLVKGMDVSAQVIASLNEACEVRKKKVGDLFGDDPEETATLFNKDRTLLIREYLKEGHPLWLRVMHCMGCWTVGAPLRAEDFEKDPDTGHLILNREIVVDELPAGLDVLGMGIFCGMTLLRCITYEDLDNSRNLTGCRIVLHPGQLKI